MKLKKLLAAASATALAVTSVAATGVMSASAVDIADDANNTVTLFATDKDTGATSGLLSDLGLAITDIYGISYDVTFDATEMANADKWVGGGIGVNSDSTGWSSVEWGKADKPIIIDATSTSITYLSETPLFADTDTWAQAWVQAWGGTITVTGFHALDKDGNELTAASTDLDLTAYIMFADSGWGYQYWGGDDGNGVAAANAAITGEGEYTATITTSPYDATADDGKVTSYTQPTGLAFAAIGINDGETNVPEGKKLVLTVTGVTVDGETVALDGTPYTSSDDGIVTRANLYNSWVPSIPEDDKTVRTAGGFLANGDITVDSITPTALAAFATSGATWTTMSVNFTVALVDDPFVEVPAGPSSSEPTPSSSESTPSSSESTPSSSESTSSSDVDSDTDTSTDTDGGTSDTNTGDNTSDTGSTKTGATTGLALLGITLAAAAVVTVKKTRK